VSSAAQASIPFESFAAGSENWVAGDRRLARRICQALLLLPLFSLILLPEYVQGLGDPETKSALYTVTVGPLRMIDVVLLVLIAVHGLAWASSRRSRMSVPKELALPGLGFVAAIAFAMIYGWLHGGNNLFFDWRGLALGVGLYGVFAMWVQSPQEADWAVRLFAGYLALRMIWIFAGFARGGGDEIVGMRIPVFDGPTLSAIVFTALLALCLSDASASRGRALTWNILSAAAYVLVLLCFRRTFWTQLGIATLLLLMLQKKRRGRKLILATLAVVIATAALGPAFYERMQSMDFTQDESAFSQGNPDHVGEVLDAWEQALQRPLMGIGLGRSFQTARIQGWKEESVMVHNAPLHVWLKYGLLGLGCYLWFHAALLRWLWSRCHRSRSRAKARFIPRFIAKAEEAAERVREADPRQLKSASDDKKKALGRWPDRLYPRSHIPATCEGVPSDPNTTTAFTAAAFCYLTAQFVVSLGFTPWPYSSLQSTTLIAFVLAVAMRGAGTWNTPRYR
jgi:O-Antigen ligase